MSAYERSQDVAADPGSVFAFLTDVENLPSYLPPIHEAHAEGEERVALEGATPDGDPIHSRGQVRVDETARRMEWASDAERKYSGWLEVAESGTAGSRVTVHLDFGPRSEVEDDIQARSDDDRDPLDESLATTLESIRRQVEGEGGKLDPPPIDA